MKHKTFRRTLAALLAAALLAGCGAKTATPVSAAAKSAGSKQPAALAATPAEPEAVPETATEAENAETPRITEQAEPTALPEDWQQRVLGEWVVFRTEVDGDVCNPAEEGESYTLKLEPGDSPDTVRATLTHISKYGDTTAETRTGVPTRGKIEFAFEGECWQIRCQRADDKNYEWAIALREDGTMTMANMGGNAEYSYIGWMDLRRTEQAAAEPPALPEDWEQQVLAEWMAVTAVTQGESYAPADRNESFTLRLEKAEITGTVTVSFIRETYVSPQIQSAAETRTGELNAGAVTGWDGEKSQGWNLTCLSEDGRSRWTISMMEDRSLRMRSTGPKKGSEVWYVFQRTEAWDDIGYTAIPRRLWGTYRAGDESAKGIRWMTFLPDGSCCMSVEWDGWNGILTGTAEGTQGRTEDGTELYFTLTDQNGRPCEFWAILLNDDGSPSGCSLKYRAGEVLFDRDTRPVYWKNDSPDLTLVP